MTIDSSKQSSDADRSEDLDVLLQVVRELEGLCKLENLVPRALLWDRPPGLPSGAELLWLVHLIDERVFLPAAEAMVSNATAAPKPPDYLMLLADNPCIVDTLDELLCSVRESREVLVDRLSALISEARVTEVDSRSLVAIISLHDRRILATFTERLYESGLGGTRN